MTPGIFSLIVGPTSVTVWFALRKYGPPCLSDDVRELPR